MRLQPMPLQIDYSNIGAGGASGPAAGVLSDEASIQAVAVTPGWYVRSGFFMTKPPGKLALEVILLVSQPLLQMRARIFDTGLDAGGNVVGVPGPIAASLLTLAPAATAVADNRIVSADFSASLVINRIYQFQIEATGGAALTDEGILRAAKLFKP